MSLASAKLAYTLQMFTNAQMSKDPNPDFCAAFTGYFKNASLDGTAIAPGTESLPHAVGALLSGITLAFKATEKNMTCMFLQMALMSYWKAKDPLTLEEALQTMWPSCTLPAVIEKPLSSFLIPALDKEGMEPLEAHMAIAGAIFEWLTTAVKVDVGGSYFYFV